MLELSKSRPDGPTYFLTGDCNFGKHITGIDLKENSDCGLYGAKDENLQQVTSICTANTEIRANNLGKNERAISAGNL